MMAGLLKWYGTGVLKRVNDEVARRLDTASIMLVNEIVTSFPSAPKMSKEMKKLGISTKDWRHMNRSKPGEPPHIDTGTLKRSIGFDKLSELERHVGSRLKPQGGAEHSYAWFLEMGTEAMGGARPYLMAALRRMHLAMFRVIAFGR